MVNMHGRRRWSTLLIACGQCVLTGAVDEGKDAHEGGFQNEERAP